MKILAIETSGPTGNICLAVRERIVCEHFLGEGMNHGREIVPAIDKIMSSVGWSAEDLELVAVSIGPGSFTGLRVGLSIAKTLALAGEVWVVGVPTLDVMVENVPMEYEYACPMTDARRGEINSSLFQVVNYGWMRQWDYQTATAEDLCDRLPAGTCLLGEAVNIYREKFARREDWIILADEDWIPKAAWVARLGYRRFTGGQRDDPHQLVPIYLSHPPVLEKKALGSEDK